MTDPRTIVTVVDPTRRQECLEALGTDTIPILDLVHADFPGEKNAPIYIVNVEALSQEQRAKSTVYLCDRYGMYPSGVKVALDTETLAVRADEVKQAVKALRGAKENAERNIPGYL